MAAGESVQGQAGSEALDARALVRLALAGAVAGIAALGRAHPGDKTMLDALIPALDALEHASPDTPLATVMARMADAADAGAASTLPLVARKGRASYLGERSAGHLDPGAASSAIMVRCLAHAVIAVIDGHESDRHLPGRSEP
jgi:dihydroxyacetone kinase-like protein